MDLEEIGINAGNWVDSAQDLDYRRAFANAPLNLQVPQALELVIIYYNCYMINSIVCTVHLIVRLL